MLPQIPYARSGDLHIVYDRRGRCLSDPVAIGALPMIEEWIDDLRAVLDAVGSTRAALLSGTGAAHMTLVCRLRTAARPGI